MRLLSWWAPYGAAQTLKNLHVAKYTVRLLYPYLLAHRNSPFPDQDSTSSLGQTLV